MYHFAPFHPGGSFDGAGDVSVGIADEGPQGVVILAVGIMEENILPVPREMHV